MIIRIRFNVGMRKVTLTDGATLDDLVNAVSDLFSLPAASIKLTHDLAETRPLASGPLRSGGLEHGSLVYLAERMEKEVTSKASIDSSGNLVSAGVKFSSTPNPPIITTAVPVAALQRAAQQQAVPPTNPLALQHPNYTAPVPAVGSTASTDPNSFDATAAAREEERLLREYLDSVPDDDPKYRRADPVRRERLLGGSPLSGIDSQGHSPFGFGPSNPETRVSSNSVGSTVDTSAELTLDEETLEAARASGLSEYDIMQMVQGAADEALAKRLATGVGSSGYSGTGRQQTSTLLTRANNLMPASRHGGDWSLLNEGDDEDGVDTMDTLDTIDRLLAARMIAERAARNFGVLEKGLAQGLGERKSDGVGRDRMQGHSGIATNSISSINRGSGSPYERHLRRVRTSNLVQGLGGPGAEGIGNLPSPPRPSAPPIDAFSIIGSQSMDGKSPKQLSLAELHRELGVGIGLPAPERSEREVRRARLGFGIGPGTNADPHSFPSQNAVCEGDSGDIDEQLLRIAINDSLLGTRPPSKPKAEVNSVVTRAIPTQARSSIATERDAAINSGRVNRTISSITSNSSSRLDGPKASTRNIPAVARHAPLPSTNLSTINLVDLDEDEQLARAIRESMRYK